MLVECEMCGLTPFQTQWVADLRASDDFDKFVGCHMTAEEHTKMIASRPHPIRFLYYAKDNCLHSVRVGQKRVLDSQTGRAGVKS